MTRFLTPWETGLLAVFLATLALNTAFAPEFLTVQNQINLFQLSIEKIIVALVMTLVIINAEIDLSVASIMGLSAALFGSLVNAGTPGGLAILICLAAGLVAGLVNAILVARVGIPSLVVTLAMLIGFRGLARVLVKDNSLGNFPAWFTDLGQKGILGPIPLAILLFFVLLLLLGMTLHRSSFGRQVIVIGTNAEVARFSGLNVARVKTVLFLLSALISALCGLLYAARLGSVRGDTAFGFELDIITMVLLGGVSIFGGKGSMTGVFLSILIILNLRNGMGLMNITGHMQTGVIGILLIASVLLPNLLADLRASRRKDA
ncbi:ABC transporter permease [Tabrizicola sp.]|jgi:rhamnose transport system permease protein|uniref:ABC transporter permease n=1 Tax=Tabrizicola sp. TaxID=2005166 RepID=UPI001A42F61D|nr:ABC transporter permease [Tabrizicola sp.]MBL9063880.1 ABC transporter permease [Tabrizicola sp.]